jgi:hypothetical protein
MAGVGAGSHPEILRAAKDSNLQNVSVGGWAAEERHTLAFFVRSGVRLHGAIASLAQGFN